MKLTRQQFEAQVKDFWSPEIYEQCKHKIEECHCGSTFCQGWVMPVTAEDYAMAIYGRVEV